MVQVHCHVYYYINFRQIIKKVGCYLNHYVDPSPPPSSRKGYLNKVHILTCTGILKHNDKKAREQHKSSKQPHEPANYLVFLTKIYRAPISSAMGTPTTSTLRTICYLLSLHVLF